MKGQKTYNVIDIDTTISKYLYQVKLQEIDHVDTLTILSYKGGFKYDICDDYLEVGRVFELELVEVQPGRFFLLERQALKVWSKKGKVLVDLRKPLYMIKGATGLCLNQW